jgi:hypothetical protein
MRAAHADPSDGMRRIAALSAASYAAAAPATAPGTPPATSPAPGNSGTSGPAPTTSTGDRTAASGLSTAPQTQPLTLPGFVTLVER